MIGVQYLLGKVRCRVKLINNQLGPVEIPALGKRLHQGRKESEKRGKIGGRKC